MNKHVGWNNHVGRTKPIIEMVIYSALTGQVEHYRHTEWSGPKVLSFSKQPL